MLAIASRTGLITPSVVVREALVVFGSLQKTGPTDDELYASYELFDLPTRGQFHIDVSMQRSDLSLPIEAFSAQSIVPAMTKLAAAIPRGAKMEGAPLPVPAGVTGAAEYFRGVGMRCLFFAVPVEMRLVPGEALIRFEVRTANALQ